jgi:molybdenum cofactor cytidylyltransferase
MISCIVLAAGESTRFGSPKALARINSKTVIEFTLQNLLKTKIDEIIVVLGAEAPLIAPYVLKNKKIKTVLNKDYKLGQTSSFKTGLAALNSNTEGVLLLPVDIPLIQPKTFDVLIEVFLKNPFLILVPVYKNKKGHPPVFSKKLFQEFKDLKNNEPLSTILRTHEAETLQLPVANPEVIQSFNTPEEFRKIVNSK